jgi:hypothetical protein
MVRHAQEVDRRYGADPAPEAIHAAGVARLVAGDTDGAITKLDAAVAARPRDPRFLNDAAAAHLQRARSGSDDQSLARARALLEEAVRLAADRPESWFNLWQAARQADDDVLAARAATALRRIEPASDWTREIDEP